MEFGKLGSPAVELQEMSINAEEVQEVVDFEEMLDNVTDQIENGMESLSEDEIAHMAEKLDISTEEMRKLVDMTTEPVSAMEGISMQDVQPNDNYLMYCTFAGCQGTCRGCAGRH